MTGGSKIRRPVQYWAPFNKWWRASFERTGRRPEAAAINSWYEENANATWTPEEMPTAMETRIHAKCLRSVEEVRMYFRRYRAAKRADGVGGMDMLDGAPPSTDSSSPVEEAYIPGLPVLPGSRLGVRMDSIARKPTGPRTMGSGASRLGSGSQRGFGKASSGGYGGLGGSQGGGRASSRGHSTFSGNGGTTSDEDEAARGRGRGGSHRRHASAGPASGGRRQQQSGAGDGSEELCVPFQQQHLYPAGHPHMTDAFQGRLALQGQPVPTAVDSFQTGSTWRPQAHHSLTQPSSPARGAGSRGCSGGDGVVDGAQAPCPDIDLEGLSYNAPCSSVSTASLDELLKMEDVDEVMRLGLVDVRGGSGGGDCGAGAGSDPGGCQGMAHGHQLHPGLQQQGPFGKVVADTDTAESDLRGIFDDDQDGPHIHAELCLLPPGGRPKGQALQQQPSQQQQHPHSQHQAQQHPSLHPTASLGSSGPININGGGSHSAPGSFTCGSAPSHFGSGPGAWPPHPHYPYPPHPHYGHPHPHYGPWGMPPPNAYMSMMGGPHCPPPYGPPSGGPYGPYGAVGHLGMAPGVPPYEHGRCPGEGHAGGQGQASSQADPQPQGDDMQIGSQPAPPSSRQPSQEEPGHQGPWGPSPTASSSGNAKQEHDWHARMQAQFPPEAHAGHPWLAAPAAHDAPQPPHTHQQGRQPQHQQCSSGLPPRPPAGPSRPLNLPSPTFVQQQGSWVMSAYPQQHMATQQEASQGSDMGPSPTLPPLPPLPLLPPRPGQPAPSAAQQQHGSTVTINASARSTAGMPGPGPAPGAPGSVRTGTWPHLDAHQSHQQQQLQQQQLQQQQQLHHQQQQAHLQMQQQLQHHHQLQQARSANGSSMPLQLRGPELPQRALGTGVPGGATGPAGHGGLGLSLSSAALVGPGAPPGPTHSPRVRRHSQPGPSSPSELQMKQLLLLQLQQQLHRQQQALHQQQVAQQQQAVQPMQAMRHAQEQGPVPIKQEPQSHSPPGRQARQADAKASSPPDQAAVPPAPASTSTTLQELPPAGLMPSAEAPAAAACPSVPRRALARTTSAPIPSDALPPVIAPCGSVAAGAPACGAGAGAGPAPACTPRLTGVHSVSLDGSGMLPGSANAAAAAAGGLVGAQSMTPGMPLISPRWGDGPLSEMFNSDASFGNGNWLSQFLSDSPIH